MKGRQAGKRKEQRMNPENAGRTGRLGSSYHLQGYLGMAEWTPEARTQLKLSSCNALSVVERLPPSQSIFLQELL